jgi:hypothetical protein
MLHKKHENIKNWTINRKLQRNASNRKSNLIRQKKGKIFNTHKNSNKIMKTTQINFFCKLKFKLNKKIREEEEK